MMPQQVQPKEEGLVSRTFSTIVFWWLTAMGMVTLTLAATIPSWVEYRQVVQVRDQVQQEVKQLEKRVDRNNYFIKSYQDSPQALDLLAISNFGYRRPDEAPMPLPQQMVLNFKPAGYAGMSMGQPVAPATQPVHRSDAQLTRVERFVEGTQALANHYLGTSRTIGLVEMFCDKTSRSGLTAAALAVLAAALFLCRSPQPGNDA
jgi:hypothetical protein